MKDLYAVLLQKERDLQRVRLEIEALRNVLPLLAEDEATACAVPTPAQTNKWPLEVTGAR